MGVGGLDMNLDMKKMALVVMVATWMMLGCDSGTDSGKDVVQTNDEQVLDAKDAMDQKITDEGAEVLGQDVAVDDKGDVEPDSSTDNGDGFVPPDSLKTGPGMEIHQANLPQDKESCAVYQDERCQDGKRFVCSVWDVGQGKFIEPDGLL
jgi:hypothetical protein